MLLSSALLVLFSFLLEAEAGPSRKHAKYDRRSLNSFPGHASDRSSRRSTSSYLTKATKPFAVNGSALPDVNFDIGESYSGLLPIDDTSDRELFFWFVPSTNPAASDEIMIWLNGGPGCSSLDGFFHENGPAIWQAGSYLPVPNTWTWVNLTNVVWVEQPVGTGYSRGTPNATNEIDVASQFRGFWKNFVDLFELHDRKVYVTGESYAGMYVPYIADGMLNQSDTTYFNVNGIMVYDPSIGWDSITEQATAVAYTEANPNDFPFNDTYIEHIHNISATCGYDDYLNLLTFPPKGPFPGQPGVDASGNPLDGCDVFDDIFNAIFEINACFDIYQVGQLCPIPWDVLGFPYSGFYLPVGFDQVYFNRTDVKKVIHAPLDSDWVICSNEPVFVNDTDLSLPSALTGGPLQSVIEKTNNVIVAHGALDMVLILNGSLLTLQNLTWNGAQGFSKPPVQPFYVPYADDAVAGSVAGAGVFGGWVTERGLTFCSVDLSGHEVPEFQPSAAYRHVEFLLGRIANLSEVSGFTTQPKYPQSQQPLGIGNGPY